MSPPVFLVAPGVLDPVGSGAPPGCPGDGEPARVVLTGPEGRHAVTVRRLRPGEPVMLTDGAGLLARCRVAAVDGPDRLVAEVSAVARHPRPDPRLVVVQALAKADRGELAVQMLTEVGVDEIIPWQASRGVTRWEGDRQQRGVARWSATAREAAKQARRAWVPPVAGVHATGLVTRRLAEADLALVLHEEATVPLAGLDPPDRGQVVVVVGPEGGIAPAELEEFAAVGARPVRLGPEVLRTSTAGPVAVAVLSAARRWRASGGPPVSAGPP